MVNVSTPEAFLSVCSTLPQCWCISHHLLQHPVSSLPSGRIQLRCLSLSWNSYTGTSTPLLQHLSKLKPNLILGFKKWEVNLSTTLPMTIPICLSIPIYIYISNHFCLFVSAYSGSNLSASENQSKLPPYSDTLPLYLQPARPLQHLPGNTHKVIQNKT